MERKRKARNGEEGRCGLEYGFGFPSLRGEWKAIDSEDESKADRVPAQGCTGTQSKRDLDVSKVTA